jgi:hypothetical protein
MGVHMASLTGTGEEGLSLRTKPTVILLVVVMVVNVGQYLIYRDLQFAYEELAADNAALTQSMSTAALATGGAMQQEAYLLDKRVGVWEIRMVEALRLKEKVEPQTVQTVVKAVNNAYSTPKYPGIRLERIQEHTAYVRILDEDLLTQRMGSTGAWHYLAVVTASLTSVPGVEKVDFAFKEGDHAVPGVYTREDFLDLWLYSPDSLN